MKKKPIQTSAGAGRAKRTAPVVPPSARTIEKAIVSILKYLLKRSYPSCLEKGFRSAYAKALILFSRYQADVLAAYPLTATCKKGCGICCNHWPEDAYSFEVQIIAHYLKKHRDIGRITQSLRDDIKCLDRIKKTVAARLSEPEELAAMDDIDPYDVALSSFYQLSRPCPLLGKKGSCTIYAIRPFTCRVYISFSSPALCRPDNILGEKAMTYLLDLEKNASELFDRLHFMYDVFDGDTGLRSMLYRCLTK